jgi:ribonuclease P protein component
VDSADVPERPESKPSERFPRSLRLRRSADFRHVQRGGVRIHTVHLVAVHHVNELAAPRFGLAVSRKVGNAVIRNRVKRWLRESIRRRQAGRLAGVDVVFIARPTAAGADYATISAEVEHVIDRLGRR